MIHTKNIKEQPIPFSRPIIQAILAGTERLHRALAKSNISSLLNNTDTVELEMTPEQLEAQSKLAVIAYLQDSSVRLELRRKTHMTWASRTKGSFAFDLDNYYYRIAQPKPWYRVEKMRHIDGDYPEVANNAAYEKILSEREDFIEWLTDRTEYDNTNIDSRDCRKDRMLWLIENQRQVNLL